MPRDGSDEVADLWAMAAELERQFAGYKQRLSERKGSAHVDDDASGGGEAKEVERGGADSGDLRGRMYEAYARRRDERLRQGWRARMERKEAEVKAFWAQLELSGRAGCNNGTGERAPACGSPTTAAAGDEEGKTGRDDDDDKKRSSDAALAPRRITGKKHARTRSFSSSSTNTGRNHPDIVGTRRALSQEPPPSEPQAADDASKENRAQPAGGAATATTATLRLKTALRRKSSVKGHGSAKQAGPKLPRSLPRRVSSGGLQDLAIDVVLPTPDAAAPVLCRSYEQDVQGETPKASPLRPFIGGGTDAGDPQTASPDSDRSEVVDAVPEGKPEVKKSGNEEVDAVPEGKPEAKKSGNEEVDAAPDKLDNPNGEITSDSDIEPSYVYINKDIVQEQSVSLPEPLAASVAVPEFTVNTNQDNGETMTAQAGATAKEIATTNAEEAPARESSGESSFSGRLGRSPTGSAAPSCSSRDQSIERVLEADAALLRKRREKSALKTPGSAGSRVSGTARSPKETPRGFKRFLSFGKKNRAREVTVIDCTSPSVSSVADDDSGWWQSAGSMKPRLGYSDAASDDADHGHTTSPRVCSLQSLVAASPAKSELAEIVPQVKSAKAHRSLFSFRALNCGRG